MALDAPLGLPLAMYPALADPEAVVSRPIQHGLLFNRETGREIREPLGKRPLEVSTGRIARLALAALKFLHEFCERTGCLIPVASGTNIDVQLRAIEVFSISPI